MSNRSIISDHQVRQPHLTQNSPALEGQLIDEEFMEIGNVWLYRYFTRVQIAPSNFRPPSARENIPWVNFSKMLDKITFRYSCKGKNIRGYPLDRFSDFAREPIFCLRAVRDLT